MPNLPASQSIARYSAAQLPELFERITRNSIGVDDYLERFMNMERNSNYPPYNIITISNTESKLEIALAGFKPEEVTVYTEEGKLFVEGKREGDGTDPTYTHRGLAQRPFTRDWTLSDETEVGEVEFSNGLLTIHLNKVVPEAHKKKVFF